MKLQKDETWKDLVVPLLLILIPITSLLYTKYPKTTCQNVFIEDKTIKVLAYQDPLNKRTVHLRIEESK